MKKLFNVAYLLPFLLGLLMAVAADAQTTVSYSFSAGGAVSGLNEVSPGITIDSNVGFGSFRNSGTSNPGIFSSQLRLYQNSTMGGSIKVYASNGVTITEVVVHASTRTGPAEYSVDGVGNTSLSISGGTYTISGVSATNEVEFWCVGSSSSTRIYVDQIDVTYTSGGGASPSVGFDASSSGVNETDVTQNHTVPVTLSNHSSNVTLSVAVDGSSTAESGDYTLNTTSLTFTADGTQNISIDINDDADTDDETIILNLTESTATGITISTSQHTITVTDDEVPPSGLQVSATNTAYTIDFDNTVSGVNSGAYAGTGLATSPSSGQLDADSWEIDGFSGSQSFGVDNTSGDYARGSNSGGSTSTGGLYAFEVGTSNFALGVQPAGSDFTPGTIALRTQNATGSSVTTWRVSYTVYVYNDQGRSTSWNLSYSTDNSSYTSVTDLDFTSTATADGSPAWSSYRHVVEFSQSVASAGDLYIRWSSDDAGGSGSRDEIAIDDIEVIANPSGNVSLNGLSYDGYTIGSATAELTSGTFTISENILNNGTINVSSGASLYQTASTDGNSGSGSYSISRSSGTLVDDTRFQYWSSPVNNTTMGTVFSGSNTADFYFFDESSGAWASQGSGSTMTPGRGYATTGTVGGSSFTETRTFSGTANNGDVSLSTSGVIANDGILVGNPYPSAISSATFVTDNTGINGTLYFWNHSTAESGGSNTDADYATWNGVGSTGGNAAEAPDDYIQSCQGFFVEAVSANPTISFNNAQRASGNNTQFFKQGVEQRKRVWLNLSNDSNDVNQLLIGYLPQATEGVDRLYDGHKFKGHPRIAFYSMIENEAYSIQGLPDVNLEETSIVPLGLDGWIEGTYTIDLDSIDNWPEAYSLQLEDRLLGTMTNLLTANTYSFTLDSIGSVMNRFYLHVNHKLLAVDEQPVDGGGNETPGSEGGDVTGIADAEVTTAKVYRSGEALIIEAGDAQVEQISIHDLSGRLCYEQSTSESITNIPWNKTGMFIVSVETIDHQLQRTKVNF